MVDASGLRAKFRALPAVIEEAITKQLEKEATRLVAEMNILVPVPGLTVAWTWGDAPAGSVTIGSFRGRETASIAVTIYARHRSGNAAWWEFGTASRVQKTTGRRTGRITAQPYFYPPYRANRQRIKNNLRAALRRAVKKLNA